MLRGAQSSHGSCTAKDEEPNLAWACNWMLHGRARLVCTLLVSLFESDDISRYVCFKTF